MAGTRNHAAVHRRCPGSRKGSGEHRPRLHRHGGSGRWAGLETGMKKPPTRDLAAHRLSCAWNELRRTKPATLLQLHPTSRSARHGPARCDARGRKACDATFRRKWNPRLKASQHLHAGRPRTRQHADMHDPPAMIEITYFKLEPASARRFMDAAQEDLCRAEKSQWAGDSMSNEVVEGGEGRRIPCWSSQAATGAELGREINPQLWKMVEASTARRMRIAAPDHRVTPFRTAQCM